MNFLELIRGKSDTKPIPISTPEWGPEADGKIFVRRLSAIERVEFYTAVNKQQATSGAPFMAFVVAFCVVDESGARGFADDAWKSLQNEPGSVIERISDAADEVNILSGAARENLKKKYEKTQSSETTSVSPEKTE